MCSLNDLKPGQRGNVVHVGGDGTLRRRAFELGIVPGAAVEMAIGSGNGARVVRVGESRLVVSSEIAGRVSVSVAAGYRSKLLSMGLTPGVRVRILRITEEGENVPGMLTSCYEHRISPGIEAEILAVTEDAVTPARRTEGESFLVPIKYGRHIRVAPVSTRAS